jgi:hypothetical protein
MCRGQTVSMGSLRLQLVSTSEGGQADVVSNALRNLPEKELWETPLIGKQFPEIDMLYPFLHEGAELQGWQPPEVSISDEDQSASVGNGTQLQLVTRCLRALWWVGVFICVLV